MSLILMAQAMKMKVGNPLRKLVLIKLADNANDNGECWPSHGHIADHCEISKRSVMNHIKALEEACFLTVLNRVKDNKKQSNLYHLHFERVKISSESPAPLNKVSSESPALGSESPALPSSEPPAHRTSHSLEPVNEPITCEVTEIFNFWKFTMGKKRSKLTDTLKSKIQARFTDGFSFEDLRFAITGCKNSSYHMGDNDKGTLYNSIELIFRNANKTEEFIEKNNDYLRRTAHAKSTENSSRKPAGGVTAADIFAGGQADRAACPEAHSTTIREINPVLRASMAEPVREYGAPEEISGGMEQGDSGGAANTSANETGAGWPQDSQGQAWQSESIPAQPNGVSGDVPTQEPLGNHESSRPDKRAEAGMHYAKAVEQEHAPSDLFSCE